MKATEEEKIMPVIFLLHYFIFIVLSHLLWDNSELVPLPIIF